MEMETTLGGQGQHEDNVGTTEMTWVPRGGAMEMALG